MAFAIFDYSLEDTLRPQPWVAQIDGKDLMPLVDGWAKDPRDIVAVSLAITCVYFSTAECLIVRRDWTGSRQRSGLSTSFGHLRPGLLVE